MENYIKTLPFFVRKYISFKKYYINPIFNVNSKDGVKRVKNEIENLKHPKSKIEMTIWENV